VKAGESIGTETARFIGALVHQLILFHGFRRIKERYKKRFIIYLDEMQNYMGTKNTDIARGLDEARKASFCYVLAHQRARQQGISWDQQRALNGCGVKIYGRMEYQDAQWLCRQLLMRNQAEKLVNLRVGEFYVKAGWLKTRFIKFPSYFAPHPSKMGIINHKLFAKTSQVKALIEYLRSKNTRLNKTGTTPPKPNQSFNFSLTNEN
jgi:hypothetical protein